jgi:hypothetical protein
VVLPLVRMTFVRREFLRHRTGSIRRQTSPRNTMTIPPDLEAHILRLYHVEKWRVGTIARQLHVHHGTEARVLGQAGLPRIGPRARRSQVEPYLPFIHQTLEKFPTLTAPVHRSLSWRGGIRTSAPITSIAVSPDFPKETSRTLCATRLPRILPKKGPQPIHHERQDGRPQVCARQSDFLPPKAAIMKRPDLLLMLL